MTAQTNSTALPHGGPKGRMHCQDGSRLSRAPLLNAFTVDVEDYFQVTAFERDIHRDRWDHFECRVVANTHRILQLLNRHNVRATFFVLGWIAHRHPRLVREIHESGHEIGSHGYWHQLIYKQSPDDFRADVQRSRDAIESTLGERITCYRAPSFSVTKQSLWALDILVEEGFKVDTSIYPTYHDRYGIPDAQPHIHQISTSAGAIVEFPPAVAKLARWNIPVSGGGYFRFLPLGMTIRLLDGVNRKHRRPFPFYIHPWELDPEQPRMRAGSRTGRFRHYLNLHKVELRLDALLRRFRFGSIRDVLDERLSRPEER